MKTRSLGWQGSVCLSAVGLSALIGGLPVCGQQTNTVPGPLSAEERAARVAAAAQITAATNGGRAFGAPGRQIHSAGPQWTNAVPGMRPGHARWVASEDGSRFVARETLFNATVAADLNAGEGTVVRTSFRLGWSKSWGCIESKGLYVLYKYIN